MIAPGHRIRVDALHDLLKVAASRRFEIAPTGEHPWIGREDHKPTRTHVVQFGRRDGECGEMWGKDFHAGDHSLQESNAREPD